MMNKEKNKGGAPTKYDPKFHPEDFISQSRKGNNITQIASSWMIHKDSVYEWGKKHPEFSDSLKLGRQLCEDWYLTIGKAAMAGRTIKVDGQATKVDLGFFVWMTKNVCKWSDKVQTEDTTPVENKVLSVNISEKEVKKILSKIEKEI